MHLEIVWTVGLRQQKQENQNLNNTVYVTSNVSTGKLCFVSGTYRTDLQYWQ